MSMNLEIRNNELFKQTFLQAFIGLALTNEEGCFLEVNESICNWLGYSFEELRKISICDVTFIEDYKKTQNVLSKLKNKVITNVQMEVRYISKTGNLIWTITNFSRVKDSNNFIAQIQDVTEQRQKEKIFKEKEAQYHLMSEYSSDLIARHFPDGRAFCVSPSAKEILGYDHEELIGFSPYDEGFIHPDDLIRTINSHKYIAISRQTAKIRYRLRRKDGSYTWIESTGKGIFNDKTNQLEEIITVSRDCSDHVRRDNELIDAKEKLAEANLLISNILDSITDGFFALDYEGNIAYLNHKVEQLINKNKEQLIGKNVFEEFPLLKETFFENKFFEATQTLKPTKYEVFSKLFKVWLDVRLYPRKDLISIYFSDISNRKKVEQELKESEERFRTIVQSSIDAIGIHSLDGKFLFGNEALYQLLGIVEDHEILNQHVFKFLHPEGQEIYNERMKELNRSSNIKNRLVRYKLVNQCEGIERDVEVTADQIIYKGEPAVQFIARDITERKKYEEFLHKADKLNVVGELAAGVAHEIRNPLTTIKGFFQLIQASNHGFKDYFDLINSEFERVESIIFEFLSLAKPHNETLYKKENLNKILDEVVTLENANALLKNIELKYQSSNDNLFVYCDKRLLKQVFINILQNAIDASNEKGKIEINVEETNRTVDISFKDFGCGIPKHIIHRLGEPFYTLKEKGTGLGLMICFKIIENHQGTIIIESEEGVGTNITVQLPLCRDFI